MSNEKKMKTISLNSDFDAEELESSIDDAIKFLQKRKEAWEGAYTNIQIKLNGGDEDWCSDTYYSLTGDRLETDHEFHNRIDKNKKAKENRKANLKAEKERQDKKDREDYIRLKKKFDSQTKASKPGWGN